jgi:hypothetical protein
MMFIVRTVDPPPVGLLAKVARHTPELVARGTATTDYFCVGDIDATRAAGLPVVALHDGWYADDGGGGVAIWGQGKYWEVRDTPFTVREAAGPSCSEGVAGESEVVNVRQAIFGA